MPFDTSDLDTRETALLALEYVRNGARWFEEAAQEQRYGDEVLRVLSEVAAANREFAGDLEIRIEEHFGTAGEFEVKRVRGLKRPDWLVEATSPVTTRRDVLEVATAEQEEHYQFFLQEESEVDDPWLQRLFGDLGRHARRVLVFLEEEREGILDQEG